MTPDVELAAPRSAPQLLAWSRRHIEPELRSAVDRLPTPLRLIAGYHFGWWDADGTPLPSGTGGKAIRPALALLAAEATSGDSRAGLVGAVAVELVHNFTLVHDDVIDGDLTRRHRPTAWSVFGSGAAIVAGDALLTLALEVLATSDHPVARQATHVLSTAIMDLMQGQYSDVDFERRTDVDLPECVSMAEGKSGALLGCACALGAILGGGSNEQTARLRSFGEQLGVAFQLVDDLLGIWGDPRVTGKPIHADLRRRKKSLPVVAALTSGTPAGMQLAELYQRSRPISDAELVQAAELVELAGGRAWCQARAQDLVAAALEQLHAAVGHSRPAAELAALARLAADRDH